MYKSAVAGQGHVQGGHFRLNIHTKECESPQRGSASPTVEPRLSIEWKRRIEVKSRRVQCPPTQDESHLLLAFPPLNRKLHGNLARDSINLSRQLSAPTPHTVHMDRRKRTAIRAWFCVGEMLHCVFMFMMAVVPPQGLHETTSGSALRVKGPSLSPASEMP